MVHIEVALHRWNVFEMVTITSYTLAHLFVQSHHHSNFSSGHDKYLLQLEVSGEWFEALKKIRILFADYETRYRYK